MSDKLRNLGSSQEAVQMHNDYLQELRKRDIDLSQALGLFKNNLKDHLKLELSDDRRNKKIIVLFDDGKSREQIGFFSNDEPGKQKLTEFLSYMYNEYVDVSKQNDRETLDLYYQDWITSANLAHSIEFDQLKDEIAVVKTGPANSTESMRRQTRGLDRNTTELHGQIGELQNLIVSLERSLQAQRVLVEQQGQQTQLETIKNRLNVVNAQLNELLKKYQLVTKGAVWFDLDGDGIEETELDASSFSDLLNEKNAELETIKTELNVLGVTTPIVEVPENPSVQRPEKQKKQSKVGARSATGKDAGADGSTDNATGDVAVDGSASAVAKKKNRAPDKKESTSEKRESTSSHTDYNLFEDLEKQYEGKISISVRAELRDMCWNKRKVTRPLNENERTYLESYRDRMIDHVTGMRNDSEAEFQTFLTGLGMQFDAKEFGTTSDYRKLAKKMKQAAKKANKDNKYLQQAYQHLLYYTCARELNVAGLENINAVQSQSPALRHEYGLSFHAVDMNKIWGNPCGMKEIAQEWFPGGAWGECIRNMKVPRYCSENVRRAVFSAFYPPEWWLPMDLPGTVAATKPEHKGTGMILKTKEGTWDIEGEMSNDSLIALYLHEYDAEGVEEGKVEVTNPKIAYNIVNRWFTPGDYGVDVVGDLYRRTGDLDKARLVSRKILEDAMLYDDAIFAHIRNAYNDQTAFYWKERERITGREIAQRDISAIPVEDKYRMFSRAVVVGFGRGLGKKNDARPVIEDRLTSVFGGSWQYKPEYITNGNEIVGESMAAIFDETKGEGRSLDGRNWKDFGSIDNMYRQVEAHGITGVAGNAITTGLEMRGIRPENARRIGGIATTALKIGAVVFAAREVFKWIGGGGGFWGKLRRVGAVGVGVAMFGKDLAALTFGGKGGWGMEKLRGWLEKSDQFGSRKLDSREMLNFTFGDSSINDLLNHLQVNEKTGQFEFKPEVLASLAALGLQKEQNEVLRSLLGGGKSGLNLMVHEGLREAGITPTNMKEIQAMYGNVLLKDYIKEQIAVAHYRNNIADALGVESADARVNDVVDYYKTLNEAERKLFLERIQSLEKLTKEYSSRKAIIYDHMILHKAGIVAEQFAGSETTLEALQAGFEKEEEIAELRRQFIYGEAPFDKTNSTVDNTAVYHEQMKTSIFNGADADYELFFVDEEADKNIETRFSSGDTYPDTNMVVDLQPNNVAGNGWFINRDPGRAIEDITEAQRYQEAIIDLGNDYGKVMFGIEEADQGDVNMLTFWIAQPNGVWQKWRVKQLGDVSNISGIGWRNYEDDDGKESPSFTVRGDSGNGYEDDTKFRPDMLKVLVHNAKADTPSFELSESDYAAGSAPKRKERVVQLERDESGDRK